MTVVPDFVANAGTNVWYWWIVLRQVEPTTRAAFDKMAEAMRQTVLATLSAAAAGGVPPRQAAELAAQQRLDQYAARPDLT